MAADEKQEAVAHAPITCVAGIKDRHWEPTVRWLNSLREQTMQPSMILVDYGSTEAVSPSRLFNPTDPCDWGILRVVRNTERWSESRALNIGIRHAMTEYVMTTNADLIYDPGFVAAVVERLRKNDRSVVLADRYDLDQQGNVTGKAPNCHKGTCIATRRDWFEKVRGFDERYHGWGFCDIDIVERAATDGLEILTLGDEVKVYHQWHPHFTQTEPWAAEALAVNTRIHAECGPVVRNPDGWGEV